ncbi:MAG: hypothetical protein LC749_12105, partial [Actinobacteria bacterium]|nr:hypothetical protein [Actinomycetota bacterium]
MSEPSKHDPLELVKSRNLDPNPHCPDWKSEDRPRADVPPSASVGSVQRGPGRRRSVWLHDTL